MSVTTSIVNNVLFTQFMTELFGSVTCIGESCDPISCDVMHCDLF